MIAAIFPAVALGGFAYWAYRRGYNSAREDIPPVSNNTSTNLPSNVTEALGWPYWYGKGTPSTPWSDGKNGVDCSGFVQMALVRMGSLSATYSDRGAAALADDSDPIPVGSQQPGDMAYYPGHVALVASYPGSDGHSMVMCASGKATTLGNVENDKVKLYNTALYRGDFSTYMRLKPGKS